MNIQQKNDYEKNLFDNILASMKKHGLDALAESVILTGSFGRGEATYVDTDGGFKLKSDVEIAIAYKTSKAAANAFMSAVAAEFEEDLNLMAFPVSRVKRKCNYNKTLFVQKYKTLFTYDLYNGSKTIWGTDYIKNNTVTLGEVDLYEAKRIVANRIGELAFIQKNGGDAGIIWKNKLLLACASAYLLCCGKYCSSYHEQEKQIETEEQNIKSVFGDSFCADYYAAFGFLRENGKENHVSDEKLRGYAKSAYDLFKAKNIKKPKTNSFSRKLKYYLKYVKNGGSVLRFDMENEILDALIKQYAEGGKELFAVADLWHNVIY